MPPQSPKGYIFSGWFTSEDCTTAYDFDAAVDDAEPEFTLHAGWKAEAQTGDSLTLVGSAFALVVAVAALIAASALRHKEIR